MIVAALLMAFRNGLFQNVNFKLLELSRSQILSGILVLFILILSLLNWLINLDSSLGITENISTFFILPFTLLAGLSFRRIDAKILLSLIAIECLVGCYEFSLGIRSVFPAINNATTPILEQGMWYSHRVYGLSTNSSVLALKVLAGMLLIQFYDFKGVKWNIIQIVFWLAVLITFNRTVIITLGVFYFLNFSLRAMDNISKKRRHLARLVFLSIVSIVAVVFATFYFDSIVHQFTRDKGVDLSGRDTIWLYFSEFIANNLWMGNGTIKFLTEEGKHGHNSFLQMLATNGLVISVFYFTLIFININRKNVVVIAAIIVYSLTQYGIFWGISMLDILLYLFLFQSERERSKLNVSIESST